MVLKFKVRDSQKVNLDETSGAPGGFVANAPAKTKILEGGLHPQTGGASKEEKVQLVGQALTHAQKRHLESFSSRSAQSMYEHLSGYHGYNPSPPTSKRISGFKEGIPQYEEVPNLSSKSSYEAQHLTLHRADLAERKTSKEKNYVEDESEEDDEE